MKITLKCRPEQAAGIAEVLAEAQEARRRHEEAQERANHFCAGVVVGLVPAGSGVVFADPETGHVVVQTPEAYAPAP